MSLYEDENGHIFEEDVETTYFDEKSKQWYCREDASWHDFCPLPCDMIHQDDHEICQKFYQARLEKYTSDEVREVISDSKWGKDFMSQWKFWLYQHKHSMEGDTAPASNQKFKPSVEKLLRNGFK